MIWNKIIRRSPSKSGDLGIKKFYNQKSWEIYYIPAVNGPKSVDCKATKFINYVK